MSWKIIHFKAYIKCMQYILKKKVSLVMTTKLSPNSAVALRCNNNNTSYFIALFQMHKDAVQCCSFFEIGASGVFGSLQL